MTRKEYDYILGKLEDLKINLFAGVHSNVIILNVLQLTQEIMRGIKPEPDIKPEPVAKKLNKTYPVTVLCSRCGKDLTDNVVDFSATIDCYMNSEYTVSGVMCSCR